MSNRSYGQYCGLARALELVGERWALLLVRDLLVGPRRFSDLRRGLPGIPTNVLSARLREMEGAGVVRRRLLDRPSTGFEYELTEYGRDLAEPVMALGRWGARSLGEPRAGETVTAEAMVMALRATFQPEAARGFQGSFELRLGSVVVHAYVDDGALIAAAGPLEGADLSIETGPVVCALMAAQVTPATVLQGGDVRLTGETARFERFLALFRIEAAPSSPSRDAAVAAS